jgi:hypothetical protein
MLGDKYTNDRVFSDPLDGLRHTLEDMTCRLLPGAAKRLGIGYESLKPKVIMNLQSSTTVNAYVETLDGGKRFRITVNDRLLIFYHKMLKIFVSTIGIGENEKRAVERPRIPYKWIVSTCANLIQAYWDGTFFSRGGFLIEELGRGQAAILHRLLWSCECYDVAHELGHVVRRLSRTTPREYAVARKHVERFLDTFPELDGESKLEFIDPWTEELCADLIGLNLTLSQSNTDYFHNWANYKQWLCAGAEITHLLQWMLNEYRDRLNHGSKISLVSSHPHDYLRWKALSLSTEKASFSDRVNCGKMFGRFAMRVLDSVLKKTEKGEYTLLDG